MLDFCPDRLERLRADRLERLRADRLDLCLVRLDLLDFRTDRGERL